MPNLPHIVIPRVEAENPRRTRRVGPPPARIHSEHASLLRGEINEVLRQFESRRPPAGIDPSLILRVRLHPNAPVDEQSWERCGLTLLSVEQGKTLVLFSSDSALREFVRQLREYQRGPRSGQKNAPYAAVFSNIDQVDAVMPGDRIGRSLRAQGVLDEEHLIADQLYILDVELWDFGGREANLRKVNELERFIHDQGGESTDHYVGESLVLIRIRVLGSLVRQLLIIDAVAQVDSPPRLSLVVSDMLRRTLGDFPPVPEPDANAPSVAILDSGLTSAHPLLAPAVGEATAMPLSLGDGADENGHGTFVGGIALYGDVEACIRDRRFVPQVRIYSVRVLNANAQFDESSLITTQMSDAVRYLVGTYGCRVLNLSLGDPTLPYRGGKVSPWASILDTLARELNVVIVVSAGNFKYEPPEDESLDAHIQRYPRYLLDDDAKIIEPATGAIVVTVGALSSGAALPPGATQRNVSLRPISREGEPSPFTRSGFGLGGAIKPELCDVGGNRAYDGTTRSLHSPDELSVVSTNRDYLRRLFAADVGTSFAAPRVANMASRLVGAFPDASANLIRALLASSATIPVAAKERLEGLGPNSALRVCGYGRPDLDQARFSDENRVVLYSDSHINHDNFHVYAVPIPDDFLSGRDARTIEVTLAYDPPVRHSRFDYLGAKMAFRLIKGKTLEQVTNAFRRQPSDAVHTDGLTSPRWNCKMKPAPTLREGGTLQKAVFPMQRRWVHRYGNTYHLIVRCEKKWARPEHAPQRYAIVVVLRQEGAVNIYQQIRQRIRAEARARIR